LQDAVELRSFLGVKRLSKVILIFLAVLLVVAVAAIFGLRAYVQGDGGRERVEEALSKALKVPVQVRAVAWHFPAVLTMQGITTKADPVVDGQPLISADSVGGSIALKPLLSGDFEIRNVVLEQPTFVWPQNAEGRWVWPELKEEEQAKPDEQSEVEEKKVSGRKSRVLVRGIKLLGGGVQMNNAKGEPLIVAEGVMTEFSEVNEEQLIGVVTAGRLVWGGRYALENVRMNLRYKQDVLELKALDAAMFGGAIHGDYEMNTKAEGQPFKARIELRRVDLNLFAPAAGWADGDISGKLSGEAELTGRTDRIALLEGPGRISIADGRFTRLGVFGSLASLLGITELTDLRTREASAAFNLRDEKVFIPALVLATENLRLTADGEARFDTKLKLDAQLSMPERFVQTLPEIARGSFTKLDDGRAGLDFKITGNTNKPKTDLAERLIGGKVQDKLGDLLGSLFGAKPEKKEKDEKKDDEKKKDDERP